MKTFKIRDLLRQSARKVVNLSLMLNTLADLPHLANKEQLEGIAKDFETEAECLRAVLK